LRGFREALIAVGLLPDDDLVAMGPHDSSTVAATLTRMRRGRWPATASSACCLEVFEYVGEDVDGAGRRFGLDAQAFHGRGVVVHIVAFVEVKGAGELFDVDDVR
jgi:hypothetical protein